MERGHVLDCFRIQDAQDSGFKMQKMQDAQETEDAGLRLSRSGDATFKMHKIQDSRDRRCKI
jgi:hypothetical protein